ncbi:FAD/NAD(P)-binding protein [bacterium]|nr:FAD/NAD(P)-binding protein [bacterium]
MENIYKPHLVRIEQKKQEAPDTYSLRLVFVDEKMRENFQFRAGQFGEYSVFGYGESPFCIASPPTRKGYIECCFRAVGRVTKALMDKEEGDYIGFRGPYGNYFPIEKFYDKNLLFIAGGIALPPLRSVIWNVLDLRERFGEVTILYGARTVADMVYKNELQLWEQRPDVKLIQTVDPGGETPDWKGKVGLVPHVLKEISPQSKNTIALVCGPPIMIKFTFPVLKDLGFSDEVVYTTLENKMKCGLGKCGRCNIGNIYVCKDGPVFTLSQINRMPPDF